MLGGHSEGDGFGGTRRERLHQHVLRDIKAAAVAELRRHGPSGVTMRSVARTVGITPSGLYRYVEDHNALLGLLTADACMSVTAAVEQSRAGAPPGDHTARWFLSCIALRQWCLDHDAEYDLMTSPAMSRARTPVVVSARREGLSMWARMCDDAIASGELDVKRSRFPIGDVVVGEGGGSEAGLSLAASTIAALSGHIAFEIRLGGEGFLLDPDTHYSDYVCSVMEMTGFTTRPGIRRAVTAT